MAGVLYLYKCATAQFAVYKVHVQIVLFVFVLVVIITALMPFVLKDILVLHNAYIHLP